MRILAARNAAGTAAGEKPGFATAGYEQGDNGEYAESIDSDARDMRKLGVEQETKVRRCD